MLDPLKLELRMVLSHHVGTENQSRSSAKTNVLTAESSLQSLVHPFKEPVLCFSDILSSVFHFHLISFCSGLHYFFLCTLFNFVDFSRNSETPILW